MSTMIPEPNAPTTNGALRWTAAEPDTDRATQRSSSSRRVDRWFPYVCLLVALGVLCVALGYNRARTQDTWSGELYWLGLLTIFLACSLPLVRGGPTRGQRVALLVLLTFGLYLVKVLYSPLLFDFPDELQHFRTTEDILQTGGLFQSNPILPASAFYPGMESITQALSSIGGLSLFHAGVLVVGAARVLLALVLYLLFEQTIGSGRGAGIATLVYIGNPSFMYFDAQFAYESVALPLAVFALYAAGRRLLGQNRLGPGLSLGVVLAVGAVAITHHFTAQLLALFLAFWCLTRLVVGWLTRARPTFTTPRPGLAGAAMLAVVAALGWIAYMATIAATYLGPHFVVGAEELVRMVAAGEQAGRTLFKDSRGGAPLLYQLTGYASTLLVVIGLPLGAIVVWRRYRANAAALALTAVGLLYPMVLPLRLVPDGVATAGRLPEFLYLGIGLTLGVLVIHVWPSTHIAWPTTLGLTACAMVLLAGGDIVGWGPPGRLPGPFVPADESRSVDARSLGSADWMRTRLGPNEVLATDQMNGLVMGSYGDQQLAWGIDKQLAVSPVFFAADIGPFQQSVLRRAGVQFVLIDERLSEGLPVTGYYYDTLEPDVYQHTRPLDLATLTKFDRWDGASRVLDDGAIWIYDIRGGLNAPMG
jgi:hypothetical protein